MTRRQLAPLLLCLSCSARAFVTGPPCRLAPLRGATVSDTTEAELRIDIEIDRFDLTEPWPSPIEVSVCASLSRR